MEILRIPKARVAALLGFRGKIEKKYKVEIKVDEGGEVQIGGDTMGAYFAKDVVQAVGRGFEPSVAVKLFKDNYSFYLIELREHFHAKNALRRVKGRIIGEEGKIKDAIERATESKLSIYGHTVGIISPSDTMEYAKEAIGMLVNGAPHSTLIHFLRKVRGRIMFERLRGK